jgi:hypothetical protein
MPTWAKVILSLLLIGVLIIALVAFLTWRWVKNNAADLEKGGKAAVEEAQAFGRGKPAEACITETLNRVQKCDGFICEAKSKIFLTNCLGAADVTPELCANVPDGIVAGATWSVDECARRGRPNDQRCIRAISGVAEFCRR